MSLQQATDYDRKEDVSIEELKRVTKFKDYDNESLIKVIGIVKRFTQIACENWASKKQRGKDKIIALDNNNKSKAA